MLPTYGSYTYVREGRRERGKEGTPVCFLRMVPTYVMEGGREGEREGRKVHL